MDLVKEQLEQLPMRYEIEARALVRWSEWYENLSSSEHSKRLDTIGFRLMPLLALMNQKQIIDMETVDATLAMLDYEIAIRRLSDPIDADNARAAMEENIRRQLSRGSLTESELKRKTNANRSGLWNFREAISELVRSKEIIMVQRKYTLASEDAENE